MNTNDPIENLIKDLRYPSDSDARGRILERAYGAMEEMEETTLVSHRSPGWRITMNTPAGKLALAAAAIMIVLGGITLWPVNNSGSGQWWLGPSAAWGQEILDSLGSIEAVVYRQRSGWDSAYGTPEMNVGWERRYNAKDCYRRDRYDDGVNIMNTQWVISEGDHLTMVEVSHEFECFFTQENEAYGFMADFLENMRFYVGFLDKADRVLEPQVFDGHQCVGFEIGEARYGDNLKGQFDRIWYDLETKLPMRIERHGLSNSFDAGQTLTIIHDQFEYYAEVPADLFVPVIPEGYVNAHPDDIRKVKERESKSEMLLAETPDGLKADILAALKSVRTGSYHDGRTAVSFSQTCWRKDFYSSDGQLLLKAQWFVPQGDMGDEPFEPTGKFALTETTAELGHTEMVTTTRSEASFRSHPMSRIMFVSGLIDKADLFFDSVEIDGVDCYGFEVSAKKYGDNPDGMVDRVYFDVTTNLPVRIEFESIRDDGTVAGPVVKDQFEWNQTFPEDFFTPKMPPSFAIFEH